MKDGSPPSTSVGLAMHRCKRLQTDYIDLYQMHHIDRGTGWDEIWEAMEVLRNQGKILYVGSSNFAGWHIAKAQAAAAERHFMGLVSEQSIYNLLVRDIELEVLPAAAGLRRRRDPVVAVAGRPPRWRGAQGARRKPSLPGTGRRIHRDASGRSSSVRGPL